MGLLVALNSCQCITTTHPVYNFRLVSPRGRGGGVKLSKKANLSQMSHIGGQPFSPLTPSPSGLVGVV